MTDSGAALDWRLARFDELGGREVHDLLQLRSRVFVLEQACPYLDIDGLDTLAGTRHLLCRSDTALIACARSLAPPDPASTEAGQRHARIGRVVVAESHRRRGLAAQLLQRLLAELATRLPGVPVQLDAQLSAEALYAAAGFARAGDEFLDDGIPHVTMRRPA